MTDRQEAFPGLDIPIPGTGAYASADDLMQLSDLAELDLVVKRWKKNGIPLRIRVKALSFDQQEKVERMALVKVDSVLVRSEAAFAAWTLFEGVQVPKLTIEQAKAMRAHNPQIIATVVQFIHNTLSVIDQDMIDALVDEQIPGASAVTSDASADAISGNDPPIENFAPPEELLAP